MIIKDIPKGWKIVHLDDITTKIGSGSTPRGGESAYIDVRENYAFIRSQNVFDFDFSKDGIKYITDEDAEKLKGVSLLRDDILLNITGDGITFGRCCMVPNEVLPAVVNQHVSIIRLDTSVCLPRFLLSYLCLPEIKYYMESFNAGGSRRAITKGHISSFEILLPPMSVQTEISNIVKNINKKITLNRQINHTLEQMAQALFQSWFVDFDPVIDNALDAGSPIPKPLQSRAERRRAVRADAGFTPMPDAVRRLFPNTFVERELGWVPEGWDWDSLASQINLIGGGTPKRSIDEYWGGNIPWFSVKDAPNDSDVHVIDTDEKITEAGLNGSSTKLLPIGTTIISARGTVGKLALVGVEMAMNQSCYGVLPKDGTSICFNYFNLKQAIRLLQQNTHGAVFDTITKTTFETVKSVVPSFSVLNEYEDRVSVIFDRMRMSLNQNRELCSLRDTLLPKLISGELRLDAPAVKQAQAFVENMAG